MLAPGSGNRATTGSMIEERSKAIEESPAGGSSFLERFILLFFGFVFVAIIVGAAIWYETTSRIRSERAAVVDNRLVGRDWQTRLRYQDHVIGMQRRTFNELTSTVGKSLQTISGLTWTYDEKLGANDLVRRLDQYQRAQAEWEMSKARLKAMVEVYFGSEMRDEFEFEIGRELDTLGAEVERIYTDSLRRAQAAEPPVGGDVSQSLRSRYSDLDVRFYSFMVRMMRAIDTSVGSLAGTPPDAEERGDDASVTTQEFRHVE